MKILVIFSGKIRENLEMKSHLPYMESIKSIFGECTTYLNTWKGDISCIKNVNIDRIYQYNQPTNEMIEKIGIPYPKSWRMDDSWSEHKKSHRIGYYGLYSNITKIIDEIKDFDFICYSRIDLFLSLKNFNINSIKKGVVYQPMNFWCGDVGIYANDHFLLTDSESFINIFNISDIEKFNSDIFDSWNPEELLKRRMDRYNLKYVNLEFEKYLLDGTNKIRRNI